MFVAISANNYNRVMNFRAMMGNNNGGEPEKVQPALCGLAIVRRLAPGLAATQCGKTQQSYAEQHRGSGFRDLVGRRKCRGNTINGKGDGSERTLGKVDGAESREARAGFTGVMDRKVDVRVAPVDLQILCQRIRSDAVSRK